MANEDILLQYIYEKNMMNKILVIRLYFLLDALHVSDYISPSSGATYKISPDDGLI